MCRNMVSKLCIRCKVNSKKVECYKVDVECNAKVTATVKCEHEVTWHCGRDDDPRLDPPEVQNCLACVLPKWRLASIPKADDDEYDDMRLACRDEIVKSVSSLSALIKKSEPIEWSYLDYLAHLVGRQTVMTKYGDFLDESRSSKILSLPPPNCGSQGFFDYYDIVFRTIDKKQDAEKMKNRFGNRAETKYGCGTRLLLLSEGNLRMQQPSKDGVLRICVGVAFRHRCLEDSPPFCVGKSKEDLAAAEKQAGERRKSGYDCVHEHIGKARAEDGTGAPPSSRVYWTPAVAMPLRIVDLMLHTRCEICTEYRTEDEGLRCSNNHLVCWDEDCLESYVNNAGKPGGLPGLIDGDGNLRCPHPGCTDRYNAQHMINSKASAKQLEALEKLRKDAHGVKEATAAREQLETEMRLERERIAAIEDLSRRRAEVVKKIIVDDVLALRCPRCTGVFVDFNGCFALTCHCGAGLCAWCLKDCGRDAHTHVASCPEGTGDVFGELAAFNLHQNNKRKKKVQEMMGLEPLEVQRIILIIIETELRDLGIRIAI